MFEKLKERFMTEPVLVTPDLDKEMRVLWLKAQGV